MTTLFFQPRATGSLPDTSIRGHQRCAVAGRDLLALFALGLLLYLPATRQAMSLRDVPERAPALRINAQQKQQQHSRLRLRGGVFTPDELQEMYTTEQHANQVRNPTTHSPAGDPTDTASGARSQTKTSTSQPMWWKTGPRRSR
eukprot:2352501-Rhodomonas_salina.1